LKDRSPGFAFPAKFSKKSDFPKNFNNHHLITVKRLTNIRAMLGRKSATLAQRVLYCSIIMIRMVEEMLETTNFGTPSTRSSVTG
jgi:hypothetical protein